MTRSFESSASATPTVEVFAFEQRSTGVYLPPAYVDGVQEVKAFEALPLAVEEDGECIG
jgi:hypothetical protein